jgi:hypothetical protein
MRVLHWLSSFSPPRGEAPTYCSYGKDHLSPFSAKSVVDLQYKALSHKVAHQWHWHLESGLVPVVKFTARKERQ